MPFFKSNNEALSSDEELVLKYKESGSLDLLAALYSRYMDLCYGVCLKYLKDREQAQDAVLHIFEELIEKRKKHEPQNFRSWLYTVAKNHCLMQLRSAANIKMVFMEPDIMQSAGDVHPDGGEEKEMQINKLSECIETLSQDQKASVELFYLQEKCYKEIVMITGLDMNKVRSNIQNGRRNLRICMEKRGVYNNGTTIK